MNIKIFNNDIPADLKLDNEEVVALDCEALGLVLGRDPLTLIQIGLKSKDCYIIKLKERITTLQIWSNFYRKIQLNL